MSLKNKKILIGMTGGIACYKIPYLVRLLKKEGAEVKIIMTESATKFITPLTMETVSENVVAVDMFESNAYVATRHIDLSEWADVNLIAPATANCLGKLASGISDDLLTTVICATTVKTFISPAMNVHMWENKITQRNIDTLKDVGFLFIEPTEGEMACNHFGVGRMPEPEDLFKIIQKYLTTKTLSQPKKKSLQNIKILITAGPTREQIDPVRFISNNSSGKMGFALAHVAKSLGADVTLIAGPTSETPPLGVKLIHIRTTDELCTAVKKEYKKTDCLIMAAAPADFKAAKIEKNKIKKENQNLQIPLQPTVDILKEISKNKTSNSPLIVGFALETENGIANAKKKLKNKKLDAIILNQPSKTTAFETDTNEVTILIPNRKDIHIPLSSKQEISARILDIIADLL